MLYMNPKVAQPDPRRPHARPRLQAGESLYHGAKPLVALDGTTGATTEQDWRELRASVGGWTGPDGSTWNLQGPE